jgi:hypothetical protein
MLAVDQGQHLREGWKMAEQKATTEEQKKMEERSLSVFASEKKEDITALIIAFALAILVIITLK